MALMTNQTPFRFQAFFHRHDFRRETVTMGVPQWLEMAQETALFGGIQAGPDGLIEWADGIHHRAPVNTLRRRLPQFLGYPPEQQACRLRQIVWIKKRRIWRGLFVRLGKEPTPREQMDF